MTATTIGQYKVNNWPDEVYADYQNHPEQTIACSVVFMSKDVDKGSNHQPELNHY
jgi:hypothetical protein